MALRHTIAPSTSSPFTCVPKHPALSLTPFFSTFPLSNTKQLRYNSNFKLKCSVSYRDDQAVKCPRPAEIPWKKELCNTVHLIGNVGTPVEIKHLPSGKVLAWTRLAVRKSATESSWINLTFWDELAQVAFQYVEKGHQIYVSGRLIADTVENDDGKSQTYYKVVVQELNFIERGSSLASATPYDRVPNFAGRKNGYNSTNDANSTVELWQAFFASPLEWWDNRRNKRNPKYPDFKHKDTGEALWVEGRYNPPWVKSQLAILDERLGSLRDQDAGMQLTSMISDDFVSF